MRRLLCVEDIRAAAAWRLRAWPPDRIDAGLSRVARLVQQGIPFDEDHPAIAEALTILMDGREAWGALCALAVLHADRSGDAALFWSAGLEVLRAYEQAQRGSTRRRGDALDELIRVYLAELPDVAPVDLWRDFTMQAAEQWGGALADFDERAGLLSYEPHPGADLVEIDYAAFRRRVQRARKTLCDLPVPVAPDPENAEHEPPDRVAA